MQFTHHQLCKTESERKLQKNIQISLFNFKTTILVKSVGTLEHLQALT